MHKRRSRKRIFSVTHCVGGIVLDHNAASLALCCAYIALGCATYIPRNIRALSLPLLGQCLAKCPATLWTTETRKPASRIPRRQATYEAMHLPVVRPIPICMQHCLQPCVSGSHVLSQLEEMVYLVVDHPEHLHVFCSPADNPPRKGLEKIDLPFTGGSCQRSPEKMRLMPTKGRGFFPALAYGCLLQARRRYESSRSSIRREAVLASSTTSHRIPCTFKKSASSRPRKLFPSSSVLLSQR